QQALTYATTPLHGAASTLNVVDDGTMGSVAGYLAEDYLLQHGRHTRRATCPPASAWRALVVHVHDLDDVRRLAYSADTRWRYRYAEHFYRRWAADGDHIAARRLADLLTGQDRVDEAVDLLQAHAEDGPAAGALIALLARQGE